MSSTNFPSKASTVLYPSDIIEMVRENGGMSCEEGSG
jgi:hypothetical protein